MLVENIFNYGRIFTYMAYHKDIFKCLVLTSYIVKIIKFLIVAITINCKD